MKLSSLDTNSLVRGAVPQSSTLNIMHLESCISSCFVFSGAGAKSYRIPSFSWASVSGGVIGKSKGTNATLLTSWVKTQGHDLEIRRSIGCAICYMHFRFCGTGTVLETGFAFERRHVVGSASRWVVVWLVAKGRG